MGVSVSSYQRGGLCRLPRPRKIKCHACALSLAKPMRRALRQLTQILLSKCALSALTDPHVPHRPRRIPRHSFNHISAPRPSIVLKFARVAAPCAPLDIQNSNGKA